MMLIKRLMILEKNDNNSLETLNEFNNYLELLEKQLQINKG